MDIAPLSAPLALATGLAPARRNGRAAPPVPVSDPSVRAVPGRAPVERIVQGELLGRDSAGAASAAVYLHGRVYEALHVPPAAYPPPPVAAGAGERAIGTYLGYTRDGLRHAITRGRAVDYFV